MDDLTIQNKRGYGFHETHKRAEKTKDGGFADYVKEAVGGVNDMKLEADRTVEQMVKGQTGIHEAMIALQKADISMRLLLQVRNKAIDAYREVMRMQF